MFSLPLALGTLVPRIVYVTVRSLEPWCDELVTSLFAVGSLGVKSFLRYRSLFHVASLGLLGGPFWVSLTFFLRKGASVLIIVYVTVRSWEPWC